MSASLSNRNLSSIADMGTLELQLKYVDEVGNHVNIICGVFAGADSLPNAIISRIQGFREKCMLRTKIKFPEQVKIQLSKKEMNTLIKASVIGKTENTSIKTVSDHQTKDSYDAKFLNRIIQLMEKNLSDDSYWVDNLAQDMHVSRSTLFRKLKSLTGMSPQEFMRTQRLDKAVNLLEQGPLRISDVAYQVGFSDPNYFSKCFRKCFGTSPSSFVAEVSPNSQLLLA
ncbi:AraC family transcriptional regulator [Cytophaga sp. FL35]|uniref:helix-turn-helix domain-containing protein n=1 Tax=Cytophaga sp. FL35 TaxID=1904456 RepID=UPI0016536CD4|nr:AraC family transcriptional regulator [Cytophaga sp. FL35]MBC6997034.1 helix-turn-helix transcriptional regulator [Cytophaga sp. FL35]